MPNIQGIPAFDDNYIWLIQEDGGQAAVVDPGDEEPVLAYLEQSRLNLAAILITHKHGDHVGGIAELKARYPDCPVYGPRSEPIRHIEIKLGEGDLVEIPGMSYAPQILDVPGHTEGHIAYYTPGTLFCGDTLFACGCGRVFSGTFSQLHRSLNKIASLPEDTLAYCAHEYTQDNIGFAKWVEPENMDLLAREQSVKEVRANREPTVPSVLSEELKTNPFLRADVDSVKQAAEAYAGRVLAESEDVFTTLRQWKDREYD